MRRTPGFLGQVVIGLLLGMLLMQTTALAQFGGPVAVVSDTSPTSLKQLVEMTKQTFGQLEQIHTQHLSRIETLVEYVKTANRWVETVRHYAQVVEGQIRQFTTLKGIMAFSEKKLGLDEDTLKAMASLNDVVRGIVTLKNQMESLVTTRIRMVKNMMSRARAGIFNPSADLDDLEDYLSNSIGRSASEVIATRARLAQFDNELERWTHDLELLRAREAAINEQRTKSFEFLKKEGALETRSRTVGADENGASVNTNPSGERVSASADAIKEAQEMLRWCDSELAKLAIQISELIGKITERYKKYHMRFDLSKHTAEEVVKRNEAWDNFMSIRNEAALEMLEGFHGDTPPRLKPPRPKR